MPSMDLAEPGALADDSTASAARTSSSTSLCSVCKEASCKYTCPGCRARTCSLACVKQHKHDSGCTGKRDRLAFVPLQSYNDSHLRSDYRWLEEVGRAGDVAQRSRPPGPKRELPSALSGLVYQARMQGIQLVLMNPGMQRRRENSTRYDFRNRSLSWRVEWRFILDQQQQQQGCQGLLAAGTAPGAGSPQTPEQQPRPGADGEKGLPAGGSHKPSPVDPAPSPSTSSSSSYLVAVDAAAAEDTSLVQLVYGHMQYKPGAGGLLAGLRPFRSTPLDQLVVLMRKEGCPANVPQYYQLDPSASLSSQLRGKMVLEYPTLLVLLPHQLQQGSYSLVTPEQATAEEQQLQQHWRSEGPGAQNSRAPWGPQQHPLPAAAAATAAAARCRPCVRPEHQGGPTPAGTAHMLQPVPPTPRIPPPRPPPGDPPPAAAAVAAAAGGGPGVGMGPKGPQQQQQVQWGGGGDGQPPAAKRPCLAPVQSTPPPAAGGDDDDDDVDLLAGLEEEDDRATALPAVTGAGGEPGRSKSGAGVASCIDPGGAAALMAMFSQYDENEIILDNNEEE